MAFYNIFESNHSSNEYNDYCIDESTITMPLYNNRYSNISDMYEVACQLEIDGNDLIHEMEMNILMNEHNYFVEHGRAVQYSDGYGYLTEEGNSVWRFIQKAWETLMKYLDQCVSWVIDKCKEWILYFRQAWAKWGMKDGLKGIVKKCEENFKKLVDNNIPYSYTHSTTIKVKNIEIANLFSGILGGSPVDLIGTVNSLIATADQYKKDAQSESDQEKKTELNRKENELRQYKNKLIKTSSSKVKITTSYINELLDKIKDFAKDNESVTDIKDRIFTDDWKNLISNTETNDTVLITHANITKKKEYYENLNTMKYIGEICYNLLQKDLSETLGKVFEEIRKRKKEIRQDRIDNRADDGDNEQFKYLKRCLKGYNMFASWIMKLFSKGISACANILNNVITHLRKENEDFKTELEKKDIKPA